MSQPIYGSLAQSARAQQLKSAKVILWILGILNIGFSAFLFSNAENELDEELGKELSKSGLTMASVDRTKYDAIKTDALGKLKLIYGAGIGAGILFVGCALLVNAKPVIATVSGLVLYLGITAALAAFNYEMLLQGIVVRVLIIAGLISAMKSALAVERQERAAAAGLAV